MTRSHNKPQRGWMVAVGRLVDGVAAKAFERHGFGHGAIALAWSELVGPELARVSRPERLTWPRAGNEAERGRGGGATLTVAVDGPRAIELQHLAPRVIEAINTLYGYRALERIRLVQAPVATGRNRSPRSAPAAAERPEAFADIHTPGLRHALARLDAATAAR